MRRILKKVASPIYNWLMKAPVRYRFIPVWSQFAHYNRKEEILLDVFGFANFTGPKGDYLEFGIWKGGSMIAAYHLSKRFKNLKDMHFYGFDSFEGLPEIEGSVDVNSPEFKKGDYSASMSDVKKHLQYSGVQLSRVTLVPGWFKDSLTEKTRTSLPLKTAAVIYIDSDLYQSAVSVFQFITPYIQDGTMIVFDDWYCYQGRKDRGEQKAFSEWLAKNRHFEAVAYHDFGWAGKAFIVNVNQQ